MINQSGIHVYECQTELHVHVHVHVHMESHSKRLTRQLKMLKKLALSTTNCNTENGSHFEMFIMFRVHSGANSSFFPIQIVYMLRTIH